MKKIISLLLMIAMLLSVSAFAETSYNDKATVKAVQEALNNAGFACGTPDGAAGKKTIAAITEFQIANGLEQTGTINDALLKALKLTEEYEEEITFKNIPWKSTPSEVLKMLNDTGIVTNDSFGSTSRMYYWPENLTDFLNSDADNDAKHIHGIMTYNEPELKIGGYLPDGINCLFLHEPSNTIAEGDEQLYGICISYFASYTDYSATLDDLTAQLTSVYGKGKKIEFTQWGEELGGTVWFGQNDTGIFAFYDLHWGYINIYYGKTNAYNTIQKINEIVNAQENNLDNVNF